ncbi:hypothetical protein M011DRAFT_487005 [Sporormia fimetaria CBS 119925]|uniref:Cell death in tomato 1 n=1 Tax=Sporormia fimetaria CBS 119925 TaxID=1340428 RepID=A0A6A6VA77_9PLEO|nr:hypothetical protein M011DRAFT_487005 [Sporormia fimetaria CBS 119925]
MHFSLTTLISLLNLTTLIFASPIGPDEAGKKKKLQPWQLSSISRFQPSGRPGTHPWNAITANIYDPNTLTLGVSSDGQQVIVPPSNATNCRAVWLYGDVETPFRRSWPCDPVENGYWTLEILEIPDFSVWHFKVRIKRIAETTFLGAGYKRTFETTGEFITQTNLTGACGGSGVCSFSLRPELSPLAMKQIEITAS